jgi:hypothetical protein
MSENPWQVDNVQAFAFLNCPECTFKSKHEDFFQEHAEKSHPLSYVLFDKTDQKVFLDENWDQNYDHDDNFVEVKAEEVPSKADLATILTSTQDTDDTLAHDNITEEQDSKVGILKRGKNFNRYYCDKEFSRLKFLQTHRKEHIDPDGNYPCRYCDKKKPKYEEISKHTYMIHWERRSSNCKNDRNNKGKVWK